MSIFAQKLTILRFLNNASIMLNYEIKIHFNEFNRSYVSLRRKIELLNYLLYIRKNINNFIFSKNLTKNKTFIGFILFNNHFLLPYKRFFYFNMDTYSRFFWLPWKAFNLNFKSIFLKKFKYRFNRSFFRLLFFWFIIFFSDFFFFTLKSYFLFWLRKIHFSNFISFSNNLQSLFNYKQFYMNSDIFFISNLSLKSVNAFSYFYFRIFKLAIKWEPKRRLLPRLKEHIKSLRKKFRGKSKTIKQAFIKFILKKRKKRNWFKKMHKFSFRRKHYSKYWRSYKRKFKKININVNKRGHKILKNSGKTWSNKKKAAYKFNKPIKFVKDVIIKHKLPKRNFHNIIFKNTFIRKFKNFSMIKWKLNYNFLTKNKFMQIGRQVSTPIKKRSKLSIRSWLLKTKFINPILKRKYINKFKNKGKRKIKRTLVIKGKSKRKSKKRTEERRESFIPNELAVLSFAPTYKNSYTFFLKQEGKSGPFSWVI